MTFSINISILLLSIIIPFSYCAPGSRNCPGLFYNCGSLQGIGYPFWGGDRPQCGGPHEFQLQCLENQTVIEFNNIQKFQVLEIDQSFNKMTIARYDLWKNMCLNIFTNTTGMPSFLRFSRDTYKNFYFNIFNRCPSQILRSSVFLSNFTCPINGTSRDVVYGYGDWYRECSISIGVPILFTAYEEFYAGKIRLKEAVNRGFTVDYDLITEACSRCEYSGGICYAYPYSEDGWECKCPQDTVYYAEGSCRKGSYHTSSHGKIVALTTGTSAAGIGIIVCLLIWYCILKFNKRSKQNVNLEAAIKQYGSITPKRYSYSDIKKMTNSFKDKLGKGGYGDVYKGNLFDNRPVAVKVLNTSKGSGEEFINEVASISRTSHVNVVTLLGFCLDGQKRALMYEFMPNGSLERYIHAETASVIDGHLGWAKLYQIALGIARGLEYLHKGCTMRIVHFDIKPHNILLDEDFCPKISDFGLSKLCTRKESILSMLEARGTIGYIAPEVVSRNFGCVSHKSDVYSYGMMLLEMVGGRKNIKIGVSRASEIYFPHWVYQRIVLDEDLKLQREMTPEEDEIARKMVLVGLWCIQTDPSQRPAVSKVIDMLQGSLQALEIPPKPFFGSPLTSPGNSLTTIVVS